MAIRINDNSGNYVGNIAATMDDFTATCVGDTAPPGQITFDGAINRAMENFTCSFGDTQFPLNGWASYGGYMIANQSQNLEVEPYKTWNEEKDILIIQGLGWRSSSLLASQMNRFKTWKDNAVTDSKLLYYMIMSEPRHPDYLGGGIVGYLDETYELINSATRGAPASGGSAHPNWYLTDNDDNLVMSSFDSLRNHRASYTAQFQDNNSFGRNMPQQWWFEHKQAWETDRALDGGGFSTLMDQTDGFFWDVVPPLPEKVYVEDAANPGAVRDGMDFNKDGSGENRESETTPADTTNEDGYGGCRMYRRGARLWVQDFESRFAGKNMVLWRNGTEDGIRYNNELDPGDPLSDSEFVNLWAGTIHERLDNDVGLSPAGTVYDVDFNGLTNSMKYLVRHNYSILPVGSHPWGRIGRYLSRMVVVDTTNHTSTATILAIDYEYLRFFGAICALTGCTFAPYGNPSQAMPRLDEYKYLWGDAIEPSGALDEEDFYPMSMGTLNLGVNPKDAVTLRAYDYTTGGNFWWQEFDNVIWVLRADAPSTGAGNYGSGSSVAVQLPDPGTGKVWKYPDFTTTYTHPRSGLQTTNQSPTINDGSAVDAGGSYGSISLLPWHARMLVREDA